MKLLPGYTPFAFQQNTIDKALPICKEYGGCCIFDETGLGKTITGSTIAINLGSNILVIAPKANQTSWRNTLPSATICTKAKIVSGSYDVVILDEAHHFNKTQNKSFKDLLKIIYFDSKVFPYVILMTATPVNNTSGEILDMLKLIPFRPSCSAFYTIPILGAQMINSEKELRVFERFNLDDQGMPHSMRKITEYVDLQGDFNNIVESFGGAMKEFSFRNTRLDIMENYKSDISLMGHFPTITKVNKNVVVGNNIIFDKTLKLINNMPFAYYNINNYTSDPKQTGLGGIMKTLLFKRLDSSVCAFKETLSKILNTFQEVPKEGLIMVDGELIAVNPKFFSDVSLDIIALSEIQNVWTAESDAQKISELIEYIQTCDGKVVVFTEYISTQTMLVAELSKHFPTLGYNGSSDEKILETIASEFDANLEFHTEDYKILVASDALAEGINLHYAKSLVHYDLKWNPSRLIQREGRINRIMKNGIKGAKIEVCTFAVQALIEAIIKLEKRITNKTDLSDRILNSDKLPSYATNVNHTAYYSEIKSMTEIRGLKFPKGYLFFQTHSYKNKTTLVQHLWALGENYPKTGPPHILNRPLRFNRFFIAYGNYQRSLSNIDQYLGLDIGLETYAVYLNPQYGYLLFQFGEMKDFKSEYANMIRKFFANSVLPETTEISAYQGDKYDKTNAVIFS